MKQKLVSQLLFFLSWLLCCSCIFASLIVLSGGDGYLINLLMNFFVVLIVTNSFEDADDLLNFLYQSINQKTFLTPPLLRSLMILKMIRMLRNWLC